MRRFQRNEPVDGGGDLSSYCMIGPFAAWDTETDGILTALEIVLSEWNGGATVGVYSAMSAEDCVSLATDDRETFNQARETFDLTVGRNLFNHLRVRGPSLALKFVKNLSTTNKEDWTGFAVEQINATLIDAGPIRRIE